MHHPTDSIIHTTAFVTPVVEHWREQEIAQLLKQVQKGHFDSVHIKLLRRGDLLTAKVLKNKHRVPGKRDLNKNTRHS